MVGMEAAALSGMLKIVGNKLAPLAIKEYSSILGVEKDLQELKNLVEQVNDLLQPVGDRSIGDAQSFNWLKNLKHVVYDADDVADEFQLEAEKHDTYGDGGVLVKYMYKKSKSIVFRRKAAKKIEEIKKRFAAIVNQRAVISAIANSLPVAQSVHHMNKKTVEMSLPIVDEKSVFGRGQDKRKIITKLTKAKDQQEIEIVSVIGLGGSGKTTFARLVFNDGDIIEKHFKLRLWVHVSQEFDVDKLFKKLFEAITNEKSEHHTLKHMSDTISKELSEKVFLLVLDDVWIEDRHQWDQFREQFMAHLKSGPRTSKILLTTRSRRVAEVVDSTDLFDLPLLSPVDSWQLFSRKFSATVPSEFKEVGEEILKKCDGVPLAIIALACVLRDKERIEQWQAIRDNGSLDGGDAQDAVFACLRLSYLHLPPHLKPCFTICSLFPKGYRIDKGQLIDQWIAHDMVAVEDGVGYLEYTADKYFDSLVQMSFLQDVEEDDDGSILCRMHDLVHDLARDILNDDETLLDGANKEANFTKSYRYYSLIEVQRNLLPENPFEKVRAVYADVFDNSRFGNGKAWKNAKHLRSITVNIVDTQPVLTAILQTKNLRYLAVSQLDCQELPEAVSDIWSLQALHLTSSHLVKLPESIGKLQKLRTLNLSWCANLKCLPDSIGDCHMLSSIDLYGYRELTALPYSIGRNEKLRVLRLCNSGIRQLPSSTTTLRNLECLDLRFCTGLVELPEGIGNLEKLQVLNLQYSGLHGGMPVGIGQLSRLQKLDLFVVDEGENCARISELANLGRNSDDLTILGIVHVMEPDDAHRACLKQKTNLQRLNLWWWQVRNDEGDQVNTELVQAVLDGLEPPLGIKKLQIDGYLGTQYARWMQNQVGSGVQGPFKFPYLRVMKLQGFPNLKDLHGLVELPCLEELVLGDMPSLASISGGPFPSLMSLYMDRLPSLGEVWVVAERIMPDGEEGGNCSHCIPHSGQVRVGSCLSDVEIRLCPKLKVKLLQSPGHLKRLSLRGVAGLGCEPGWELESLEISSEVLTELPESLRRLTSLRSLGVSFCPAIRMLPEWLGEFQSLQELSIYGCDSLSSLPQSMGHLTSLQELKIDRCGALDQLPEWLGELRSLRKLRIIRLPRLTCLPRSMWRHPSLEELYINNCPGIKSLPEAMKVRRLEIWGCPELARRYEIGKTGASSLTSLICGLISGYMSPEYAYWGHVSTKSDMFSFGVIVLEMVTGRRNNSAYDSAEGSVSLLSYVWDMWRAGSTADVVDPLLAESGYPKSEVLNCIEIGLLCVQENPADRPDASAVVLMLSTSTSRSDDRQAPSRPAFVFSSGFTDGARRSAAVSENEVSISELEPR